MTAAAAGGVVTLDVDPNGADSRRAQAEMLAGPLAGGFEIEKLALVDGQGEVKEQIDATSMLVRLTQDLGNRQLRVSATLTNAGVAIATDLVFEPYSAAGSALMLRARAPAPGPHVAIRLEARLDDVALVPGKIADWLELDLLRGNMAHVLTLLAFEHQRLRRYLAAIEAARSIPGARGGLLDRIGAELGVPRLDSSFKFAAATLTGIDAEIEKDDAYRTRLAPYRAFAFPTPAALRSALKGVHPDFEIEERTMGFESAFRLVAFADTLDDARKMRADALAHLRQTVLIDPSITAPAPANPDDALKARTALRDRIYARFVAPGGPSVPIAPVLARALDRLAELFARLNYTGKVRLVRGQDDNGGARHELGLGAVLQLPATFVADFDASIVAADAATLGVYARSVKRLQGLDATVRRQLHELLSPCGLSTAIVLDATHAYVSHLRNGAMEIDGAGAVALDAAGSATATFHAKELIPATVVALGQALAAAAATAGVAGAPIAGNVILPLVAALPQHGAAYLDLILPARFSLADQPALGAALAGADAARLSGLRINAAMAASLVAGNTASWDELVELAFALTDLGVPAMAVVVLPGNGVILIASDAPLPALGANLTLRRTLARRWGKADLGSGTGGEFGTEGAVDYRVSASAPGLYCIALMSYRRLDEPDPMEIRPTLPAGQRIDYPAYERMMNLLMLLRPLGIAINSWRIRQRHVRLDAQAPPSALALGTARSFRRFRQVRFSRPIAPTNPGGSNG